MGKTIGVAFYNKKNRRENGGIFSRFLQRRQQYWHVELGIKQKDIPERHPMKYKIHKDNVLAYGVKARDEADPNKPGKVFEQERVFSSPNYEWEWINVNEEDFNRAIDFAQKQIGKPYDPMGHVFLLFSPRTSDVNSPSWYCANLTMAILQQAVPITRGFHPGTTSTDDVYHIVNQHTDKANFLSPMNKRMLAEQAHKNFTQTRRQPIQRKKSKKQMNRIIPQYEG